MLRARKRVMVAVSAALLSAALGLAAMIAPASAFASSAVSLCDMQTLHLCISDPGASTAGGTLLDMRSFQAVASQALTIEANSAYGCSEVTEAGAGHCAVFNNSGLDRTFNGQPIREFSFTGISTGNVT